MKPSFLYKCLPYYDNLKVPDGVFEISNISHYLQNDYVDEDGKAREEALIVQHRLPYKECWFEFTEKSYFLADKNNEYRMISSSAFVVEHSEEHIIEMTIFSENIQDVCPLILTSIKLQLDENYYLIESQVNEIFRTMKIFPEEQYKLFGALNTPLKAIHTMRTPTSFELDQIKKMTANVILAMSFTMKFLNCKNVIMIDNQDKKELKKRIRKGKKFYERWKTLQVTGIEISQDQKGHQGNFNPLHICRGHFKTFTNEHPLFGRHTGTYWWSDQVRGKREIGIVEKDYSLK
jgi:hypothetical protein